MGTVYAARHAIIDKRVAIKVLRKEAAADESSAQRFIIEAKAASKIGHQNIVDITDFGVLPAGNAYFVMEFLDGPTLGKLVHELKHVPPARAVAVCMQVARGLAAAHEKSIIHRDLKPENIFVLEKDGAADFVKIVDFGIAKDVKAGKRLTAVGMVLGTPEYMSPEQATGQPSDHRVDMYALGCILYEMLTGDVPFKADAPVAVAMKHVREPMPDVQSARPEVSANTAAIVDNATAKETRNRYSTVEQMRGDLEGALALEASRAGATSGEATTVLRALPEDRFRVPWRLRFPRRAAALTALLGVLVAVALILLLSRTHESPPPSKEPRQPKGAPALVALKLPQAAAHDYDPVGGDGEHHADTGKAIDRNVVTAWTTETYDSGIPQTKPGVGLYVDTGDPVAARKVDIISHQSPYKAQVLAATGPAPPPDISGWTPVSDTTTVDGASHIPIDTKGKSYQLYLVWITELPAGGKGGINELTLSR
jgi:serine/threonine-protein kinase